MIQALGNNETVCYFFHYVMLPPFKEPTLVGKSKQVKAEVNIIHRLNAVLFEIPSIKISPLAFIQLYSNFQDTECMQINIMLNI